MEGILLIDKPDGWTSFDVVNYVRKMIARIGSKKPRNIRVGHTGTLDPAATGLLVLCVGKAYTKKVPTMIKHDKTYEVEVTLGKISSTGDKEGEISAVSDVVPVPDQVQKVLDSFVGEISQVPPAYSALKVNGKRAYQLAREGKEVKLEPRTVMIHSIEDVMYRYPKITFTTRVGSGTYIRSLAEDIGKELGTGAYMSNLRRTSVDAYDITQAHALSELTDEILLKTLIS